MRVAVLITVFLQSIFVGVHPAHSNTTVPWKVALEDEGITVYKRNRVASPYEEVRAEALLEGTVSQFTPFFSDPVNYKKWVYGALETQLLESAQPFDFVFRGVFQIPWPFENRELISRVVLSEQNNPAMITATLSHAITSYKKSQDLVRVEHFESLWSVVQESERRVRFSINMYVEPGGQLPPFIVNLVLSRIQLWSIKNLRRELTER
ncbi:MAG: hypothetical protein RJB13_127 [Pseudomonadota bacterium]